MLLLSLCFPISLAWAGALFSPDGYRIDRYRSPTPDRVDGGRTVDTATLQTLLQQNPPPVLLNVQALDWREGIFIEQHPYHQIPGSHWLPNVGKGRLEPRWERYFRSHLEAVTGGDFGAPLVFYCRADCWMSWNAVRRAARWGYSGLYWYPQGTDGWRESGLPLEAAHPVPLSQTQ
ncbi:rhodanese domain-containing protein [Marinobacterium nitratireducens]|uniref:Rhodanese domain-containing protein n=1 Tax=Marinobacterium nitratireducens TaxID=518897 RepID=A0A917Z877_9GAMM|nr:PQQ-dependent catabolism-associated CXXCW motif protein [Marinobacterium nitratireducens]GGO75589.1 rhodanese domain-containing protein [Marinobacterium nitratireducens]